nr:recombination regulator RecX [Actinomadura oligospora]
MSEGRRRGGKASRRRSRGDDGPGQEPGGESSEGWSGESEARPRDDDGGTREQSAGDPEAKAREICLRLLTGSPRTRAQLADALRRKDIPDEVAEQVLGRFTDVGLIDDEAFAQMWVQSRHAGRGLGRRALAAELRRRGVDNEIVSEAVEALDSEQEERRAYELVMRKLSATRGVERTKRVRRLVGMLARKGYPPGMAYRVVKEALDTEGDNTEDLPDHWDLD